MNSRAQDAVRRVGRTARAVVGGLLDQQRRRRAPVRAARSAGRPVTPPREVLPTPAGRPQIAYTPRLDGDADPGEVVWTWVPYEDDPSRGKDRPVVVIGHLGDEVAALQLTSRAHDDPHHHPLGPGAWDHERRPSWVRLDRVLRLDPDGIRREGAILDPSRFAAVIAAFTAYDA